MKNKITQNMRNAANILVASTMLASGMNSLAEEVRLRSEYTGDTTGESYTLKHTLGIASSGAYDEAPTAVKGQFFENIRAYDFYQNCGGQESHFTSVGLKTPEFKMGNVKSKAIVFGSFGDIQGLGIESEHGINQKTLLTLNAETRLGNDSASRLGTGLNYQLSQKVNLGAGFDRVKFNSGAINQGLLNVVVDPSERDCTGAAFVAKNNLTGGIDNSVGGFYIHYGEKTPVGSFVRTKFDWNTTLDSKSTSGELIFAQNPTKGKLGANWTVGRGVGNDDMYNMTILPGHVAMVESVPVYALASHGWAFNASWNAGEVKGIRFGNIAGGFGYMTKSKILGGRFGTGMEAAYEFGGKNQVALQPSIFYKRNNLETQVKLSQPVNGKAPFVYTSLQVNF